MCQKHGFWHIPLLMNSHAGLALDASGGAAAASLREKPELEYQNGIEGELRMITIRDLDVRLLMDSCTRLTLDAVLGLLQQGDEGGAAGFGFGELDSGFHLGQHGALGKLTLLDVDLRLGGG